MKTNTIKACLVTVTFSLSLGQVILAQSFNNFGIGVPTPAARLDIQNMRINPNSNSIAMTALDIPIIRLRTDHYPNPGPITNYVWDIKAETDFIMEKMNGNNGTPMLKVGPEESYIAGQKVTISPSFQFYTEEINTGSKFTLGLGAQINGQQMSPIIQGEVGSAIQSFQGRMLFYTGIGSNSNTQARMVITHLGNVGVGTSNPTNKFEVTGSTRINNGPLTIQNGDVNLNTGDLTVKDGRLLVASSNGVKHFEVNSDGHVVAREILVDINHPIPDYVFEEDYSLLTINELRNYIAEEGHLPNIPSAEEFELQGGIELGEMSRLLLEKQEELVLYILQLEARLAALETSNN